MATTQENRLMRFFSPLADGQAGYYQIEPGTCKITFPDLDEEVWE